MTDLIRIERDGGVALIRLNRPKHLNALNSKVAATLLAAVRELETEDAIGCIVVTGDERAFAAGADIAEMAAMTREDMVACDFLGEWDAFTATRKPKIAAVNGYALGGGCELMMMCDFAIAGESAQFGQPEIKLGIIAGMGGTQRMTRLIGRARTMDMHLTGRMMTAEEALASGLVARVVPDADVIPTAMEAARTITRHSRPAIRLAREAVMRAEEISLREGMLFERRMFHSLFGSPDQAEGMAAFLEKRKPGFQAV